MLDRSDSLTGTDENNDGIRDDIEAFIDALEVTEPVRKALKQNAHLHTRKTSITIFHKRPTLISKKLYIFQINTTKSLLVRNLLVLMWMTG